VSEIGKRVVVVGAGITGLSAAAAARDLGMSVTVIDDARPSRATYAAAGMLAPYSEAIVGDGELGAQMVEALSLWDSWRRGLQVPDELFEFVPTKFVPATFGDRQEIARWARDAGLELVESAQGLQGPLEALTEPRELVRHVREQLLDLGVVFVDGGVSRVTETDDSVVVARDGAESISGDLGLIATGASSVVADDSLLIRPVRGSLVVLDGPARNEPQVARVLRHGRPLYVIWRRSGEIVIGATSVETSLNVAEAGEVQVMLSDAIETFPELRQLPFREVRTGLRPTATSNTLNSRVSAHGRYLQLAGHYRHGILMAPLSSRRVREFLA